MAGHFGVPKLTADQLKQGLPADEVALLDSNGGFTPMLPSKTAGGFTFADLVIFAGVTQP